MVVLEAGAGVTGDALDGNGVIGEAVAGGPFEIGEDVEALVGFDVAGAEVTGDEVTGAEVTGAGVTGE
jgi:hypothetical protein